MKENRMNTPNSAQSGSQQAGAKSKGNAFNLEALTGMLGDGQLPEKLKEYGAMAAQKVKNMSTTQKVIGGAILLISAGYLTRRSNINLGGLAGKFGGLAGKVRH